MKDLQENLYYFAYGYNVNEKKFLKRVPNAKPVGEAILQNYVLCFGKPSMDGSGKASIVPGISEVYGKVYTLSKEDFKTLDKLEGGYLKVFLNVWASDVEPGWSPLYCVETKVVVYVSYNLDGRLLPNRDYLNTINQGLEDSKTPKGYLERLRKTTHIIYSNDHKLEYPDF